MYCPTCNCVSVNLHFHLFSLCGTGHIMYIVPFLAFLFFYHLFVITPIHWTFISDILLFNFRIQNCSFFYHLHYCAVICHLFIHCGIFLMLFSIFIIGSSKCLSDNSDVCVNCRSVSIVWLFFLTMHCIPMLLQGTLSVVWCALYLFILYGFCFLLSE